MRNCCDIKNPLIRNGVSQAQRKMEALSTDYVKVDEKELADFLVFAHEFAQQVKYYNLDNEWIDEADWQAFFACNTPIWIARISKTDSNQIKATHSFALGRLLEAFGQYVRQTEQLSLLQSEKQIVQNSIEEAFQAGISKEEELAKLEKKLEELSQELQTLSFAQAAQLLKIQKEFEKYIRLYFEMLHQLETWYSQLASYSPFKSIIKGLVKTNLGPTLSQFQGLISQLNDIFPELELDNSILPATISNFGFTLTELGKQAGILTLSPFELEERLEAIFQVIFQNFRQIVLLAPSYLVQSIESRQDHEPMLALYFTFIGLMKYAQDDLNRFTQRHIDFFYREILQLPDREAIPDHAHLVFELAKFQESHKLNADIYFKAGKDKTGVELFYKLEKELVVTKAQVESLKSIFLDLEGENIPNEQGNISTETRMLKGIHLSPFPASIDGRGTEFPKDQKLKAWKAFGDAKRLQSYTIEEEELVEDTLIGLLIASDVLFLQEGNRSIQFEFTFSGSKEGLTATELEKIFKIQFSGEEEWIEGEIGNIISPNWSQIVSNDTIRLVVSLETEQGAVVGYTPALPGGSLETNKPLARILLSQQPASSGVNGYELLRRLKIDSVKVKVHVDKVQNLIVQNDQGVLDPAKPFQPFGAFPTLGSNFYIGSKEVFSKSLQKLNLSFNWKDHVNLSTHYAEYDLTDQMNGYKVAAAGLSGNSFHPANSSFDLFPSNGGENQNPIILDANLSELSLDKEQKVEAIESFALDVNAGFLRLQFSSGDFFYDDFPTKLSLQSLAQAKFPVYLPGAFYLPAITDTNTQIEDDKIKNLNTEIPLPKPPYTPRLQSFSLSYQAQADPENISILHLHPFSGNQRLNLNDNPFLLPFFGAPGNENTPAFLEEGILYIGLKDLDPPTALSLLFQLAEETADTELEKTDVHWYFLQNNQWTAFKEEQILEDDSNGLIRSGIVQLEIPSEITKGNSILDPELYWIKVAVRERTGAICSIVGIHTQAAKVVFEDQGNDPEFLANPLEAGSIAKLQVKEAQIKKVNQLYHSFGGQVKESPEQFYIRISERLRHKQRAVNIFDYERLVLEKFPEIHRVRCINHTNDIKELMPGHVSLAVIPDISQRDTTNDLQPKVNINLLSEIQSYLESLSPSWSSIHVLNPLYEEIKVKFDVKFNQANFGFYRASLQQAILGYLSPWTTGAEGDIHFGGKIFRSSILNFVEEQPYVDYVLNFEMFHRIGLGENENSFDPVREAHAEYARSILVSAAADQHEISEVKDCPENKAVPGTEGTLGYGTLSNLNIQK